MESLRIALFCTACAIVYGICHDNVTARLCVEYFTVGHPPILGGTTSPTLLALGWGVIATWWVGAGLGLAAAFLCRIGSRPKLTWRHLRWPIAILMVVMAAAAIANGFFGAFIAEHNLRHHPSDRIEATIPYVAAAHAHGAAYFVGFVGGLVVLAGIWWRRGWEERRQLRAELERLRQENAELLRQLSQR